MSVLHPRLLWGRRIAVSGADAPATDGREPENADAPATDGSEPENGDAPATDGREPENGDALVDALHELGATVERVDDSVCAEEDAVAAWAAPRAPLQALVHRAGEDFGAGGPDRLSATLLRAWLIARAVATGAMIAGPEPACLLLIAPARECGPLARAAGAGLESMARTLAVEWARFAISAVCIVPGPETTAAELAQLACFLVSPAGGYLSGCRLDLGLVAVASEPADRA